MPANGIVPGHTAFVDELPPTPPDPTPLIDVGAIAPTVAAAALADPLPLPLPVREPTEPAAPPLAVPVAQMPAAQMPAAQMPAAQMPAAASRPPAQASTRRRPRDVVLVERVSLLRRIRSSLALVILTVLLGAVVAGALGAAALVAARLLGDAVSSTQPPTLTQGSQVQPGAPGSARTAEEAETIRA